MHTYSISRRTRTGFYVPAWHGLVRACSPRGALEAYEAGFGDGIAHNLQASASTAESVTVDGDTLRAELVRR